MEQPDTEALENSVETAINNLSRSGWEENLKVVIVAVLLLCVCLIVKRILLRVLDRGLDRGHIEKSFHAFIRSAVNIVLWFVTVAIVAQSLGINATSLIALVSIAGLAISLSVQDSLSNLAGGLTILSTKPFMVGDYVEIGDAAGTVVEIGMVHTKLNTTDNCRLVLPNSTVVSTQVRNYSAEPSRRVDLVVGASYDAPAERVKETLLEVVHAHKKVLQDPEPFARMSKHGDSAVEYTVRVWCETADYWEVYYDLLEQIKTAFDAQGIGIPYPQVEVYLHQ
ncbi:MAG: mechanosensitive ion channel family protein [Ruminiclostridium sp.]|jgi:small conductance mechanosensitive channel|nr:mechanosensitive ion channel family protein [Ruminiclostridium sp.]